MWIFKAWRRRSAGVPPNAHEQFLEEKRALNEIERRVLELAISALDDGQDEARTQLAVASYGGLSHAGSHVCFMIDLPGDVDPIPSSVSSVLLDVDSAPGQHVTIELFVKKGRLDSVDVNSYDDDSLATFWPAVEHIHPAARN